MSLECVSKLGTPGVKKKHHRELFNLISNLCVPLSLAISLTVSLYPAVKILTSHSLWQSWKIFVQITVPKGWNLHIMTVPVLFPSPFYRATKVKQGWSSQPTCTTARSLQGECVSVCVFCVLETSKATIWHFLVHQYIHTWKTLKIVKLTCKNILALNSAI